MASIKQDPVLVRLARRPPQLEGDIQLSVKLSDDHHGVVRLQHADGRIALKAAGLSVPYPSGLKRLLSSDPDLDLVVVERAPKGFRKAAREAGLSYLDLSGRGHVVAPGLVYVASPHVDWAKLNPSRSAPFAPKASRVVRILLSDPARQWRLSEIAELAELNPGNVHRALAALVDRGVVERDEDSYVLVDPGSLLEAWADQHQSPRDRIWLRHDGDVRRLVREVVELLDGNAVVSGEFAAEELAPYLPAESAIVHALAPDALSALERLESAVPRLSRGVGPGDVVVDAADAGYGAFREVKKKLPLAAPVQVYVDLADDRGRGREAAEHLRREVIGF